jgi:exodeoxyribonuclease VII large subunit
VRRAGLGPLYERFLKLKDTLEREGLFDPAAKRPVPEYPRAIGVVTSLAAAALRDVLTCLKRRNPAIPVIVYPAPVQGEGAAARIARALATASARAEVDVLLLVRGGGSIEDLWQFNEEAVARAIRASSIPVVVGVGHETDFTIADFAADERCPTPTAAAERVSPSRDELLERVGELSFQLSRGISRRLGYAMQTVDGLQRRLVHPAERLRTSLQHLGHLATRLSSAMRHRLSDLLAQVKHAHASLAAFDHPALLARGYSVTRNEKGAIVRDASNVSEGERLATTLSKGWIESKVLKKGT